MSCVSIFTSWDSNASNVRIAKIYRDFNTSPFYTQQLDGYSDYASIAVKIVKDRTFEYGHL